MMDAHNRDVEPVSHDAPIGAEKNGSFADDTNKSYNNEKDVQDEKRRSLDDSSAEVSDEHMDPFVPFPEDPGVEEGDNILRIRSIVLGLICGAAVNASNIYLGLKTGWTFSANLFGAIVGFAVIKFFSKTFAENFPILGGKFGPKENNIIQTAATASGGLSSIFISAIPALYQLGLLSDEPKKDFWRIVTFTLCCAYFGFFFATPLRKFFIVYVARELRLVFPTGTATAATIRSMHAAASGAAAAKAKTKAISISFVFAFVLRVVSQYAIGILWDWHIFTWFFIWGKYNNGAIFVENWLWLIEFTPAFIGSGMLVGLNPAFSFFGGAVVAWGIIGPTLVHYEVACGVSLIPDDPKWKNYISFASMGLKACGANKLRPSPRYWMLWPGVLTMIVVSFTELACQYKVLGAAGKAIYKGAARGMQAAYESRGKHSAFLEKAGRRNEENAVIDPASEEDQVKWWWWAPGLLASIILFCVVAGVQYGMPVGMTLLAIVLAFCFSFLAIQCTGVTDITPLTAASKASQIVLGGATKGEHWATNHAQLLNLLGGTIASGSANQATDLTVDFRVGFLLRTPPKLQWVAQGIGSLVAVFLAPGMFILFSTAYPCIIDLNADVCAFSAPSVSAWRAVAIAVTDPNFPIPTSSGIFAIVFSIFGAITVLVRHFLLSGQREKYRVWVPNMMAVALAFTLPQTVYGTAMVMGAGIAYIWSKKNPVSYDMYCIAIAAGLIAGEGIGGVVNAIFQVAGISGDVHGTNIACPGGSC